MRNYINKKKIYSMIALIILLVYVTPIYWMFTSGFKSQQELFSSTPTLFPQNLVLEPLMSVINAGALRYILNSFIISISTTLITVIIASLGSYAFVRLKSKWVHWVMLLFLVAQMLPPVLMATPIFIIFRRLGLINTYIAVILANCTLTIPFAVVMLRTVFMQVPEALEESARIDGCNKFSVLFYITFPVAKSGIIVVSALSFIFAFGDFIYGLTLMNRNAMQPATVGLYNFMGAQAIHWNSIMAFASLTALPLIIIFIFLQKEIVKGLSAGAFK